VRCVRSIRAVVKVGQKGSNRVAFQGFQQLWVHGIVIRVVWLSMCGVLVLVW